MGSLRLVDGGRTEKLWGPVWSASVFFSRGAVQYENPDVCISRSEAVVGKASGEGWMDGWM